jgi:hypothetical protein
MVMIGGWLLLFYPHHKNMNKLQRSCVQRLQAPQWDPLHMVGAFGMSRQLFFEANFARTLLLQKFNASITPLQEL